MAFHRSLLLAFAMLLGGCRSTQTSTVKEDLPPEVAEATAPSPKLWPDHFPDQLAKEVAAAEALHISPVPIDSPDAIAIIGANGCPFKWVLAPDYTLYGLVYLKGDLIKHSLVTKGKPVLSAGYAVSQNGDIIVDDHSGHYQPDLASLNLAKTALLAAGFTSVEVAPDGIPIPDSSLCQYQKSGK